MPYKKRTYKKKPFGTKRKFVPRGLAIKRYNQVSTKTFYFKGNGTLSSAAGGNGRALWATILKITDQPPEYWTPGVPADFYRVSRAYNEYKILAIKLRLFPANIGTEDNLPGVSVNPFQRGNCITYLDQKILRNQSFPTTIPQVMNLGSAKMILPRQKHTRTMYRPKGYPAWGMCDGDIAQRDWILDPWQGGIFWMVNGATANAPPIAYYTVSYKVIFRGRNRVPGGGVNEPINTNPSTNI